MRREHESSDNKGLQRSRCFCRIHVRPHNPVTSQRQAHWVKDLLADAGVDESFSTGSVNISHHG